MMRYNKRRFLIVISGEKDTWKRRFNNQIWRHGIKHSVGIIVPARDGYVFEKVKPDIILYLAEELK